MTQSVIQDSPLKQLLDRVMVARQLTSIGAKALDDIEPGRQLLSLLFAGTRAGKDTAPEIGCAICPSAHTDDIFEKFRRQKGKESK
jgi:hypothetical protein